MNGTLKKLPNSKAEYELHYHT